MEKLNKLTDVVLAELKENVEARRSDTVLLMGVFKRMGIDTRKSFEELAKDGELRQMESITRARRKVQSAHPELRDAGVTVLRKAREEVFKEYAKAAAD